MSNKVAPWLVGAGLGLGLGASLGVALDSVVAGLLFSVGMSLLWGVVFSQAAKQRGSKDREKE